MFCNTLKSLHFFRGTLVNMYVPQFNQGIIRKESRCFSWDFVNSVSVVSFREFYLALLY